jgi:hypothetical protein
VAFLLLAGGCGEDATTSPDLSVGPPDLGATPATSLTLTVAGQPPRALDAYYSFYISVLPDDSIGGTFLVVTAVDPSFDCAAPSGTVDALSFLFRERGVGAITDAIAARRGPTFGPTVGGTVSGRLTHDDDRFTGYELDGGVISVSAGGSVGGTLHFADGNVVVDGPFGATHCGALDIVTSG